MLCPSMPGNRNLLLVSCKSFDDVLQILSKAKTHLGDVLQAVEFMDYESVKCVLGEFPSSKYPFSKPYPHYALVEIASANSSGFES